MAKIKTLKDYNDEIIYPQSTTRAIVNAEGVNLDTLHSKFVMMEQISEIEDINNEYENTINKVTSIDNTSTDSQYPSAKAVYDAIIANKEIGIKLEIVTALPEIGDSKIIYLINNNSNEEQNIYDEYIYTNGWEKIGTTKVDLSNYATKNEIPTATSQLTNDSNFITSNEISPVQIKYTWVGTEAQYTTLSSKSTDTLYITTDSGNIYTGEVLITGNSKVSESFYLWLLPKLTLQRSVIELSTSSSFLNLSSATDFTNQGYKAYSGTTEASSTTIQNLFCQPDAAEASSGSSPSTKYEVYDAQEYFILELPEPQRVSQISATTYLSTDVYGSNDNSTWTYLGRLAGTSTIYTRYLTITDTTAWKYFKFLDPATAYSNDSHYLGAIKFKKIYAEATQKNILTCTDIIMDASKDNRFIIHTPTGIQSTLQDEHPLSNSTATIPVELQFKNMTMATSGETIVSNKKYDMYYIGSTWVANATLYE